jgi:hypothetical protein
MIGAILLGLYALIVGWGLRGGWIGVDSSYLLIALPCLIPVAWYSYGFLKVADAEQDFGLLLSAAGWALIAFGLLIKDTAHRAARMAAQNGIVNPGADNAPAATVCFALAMICLIVGGIISYDAWRREQERAFSIGG